MTARKPLVIVTRKLPAPIEARMAELFDVRLNEDDHPFSQAELAAAIREAATEMLGDDPAIEAAVTDAAQPVEKYIRVYPDATDIETLRP